MPLTVTPHRVFAAAAATLLLATIACSAPAAGPAATSAPAGSAADSGPVTPKVNRLVFATEPPSKEMNETRHNSTPSAWQLMPMYETLIGIDATTGQRTPALATAWSIEPDGIAYRFKLRKGVQFHNNFGEFTANDLIQPWKEILKPNSISGVNVGWRDFLKDIEVVNDYEAIYHLKRPDANFLDYASDQQEGYEIWSKKAFDQSGPPTNLTLPPLADTGPYAFKERAQSQYVRFVRPAFKHWHVTPDFPEFEFRWIKEASTRLAALLSGEVQVATLPQDLELQAEKQGFKTVAGKVPGYRVFAQFYCCQYNDPTNFASGYMQGGGALADVAVRKALSKAVNRDAINKAFFGGKGILLYNNPMEPSRRGWKDEWKNRFQGEYGYDPEAAKQILGTAGYGPSNPVKFTMLITTATGLSAADDIAESLAGYFRNVGVEVTLQNIDSVSFSTQGRAFKLLNNMRVNGTSSNQWVGVTQFGSTLGTRNGAGPELGDVDEILKGLYNTLDEKKIDEIWSRAGDAVFANHKYVPLFWLPTEASVNPKIVGD